MVDLTEYNISIPKDGLFISFEWLIVENNKYEYDYPVRKNANKISGIKYNPSFGVVILDESIENWVYVKGAWSKTKLFPAWHKDKSMDLAIELTLSN